MIQATDGNGDPRDNTPAHIGIFVVVFVSWYWYDLAHFRQWDLEEFVGRVIAVIFAAVTIQMAVAWIVGTFLRAAQRNFGCSKETAQKPAGGLFVLMLAGLGSDAADWFRSHFLRTATYSLPSPLAGLFSNRTIFVRLTCPKRVDGMCIDGASIFGNDGRTICRGDFRVVESRVSFDWGKLPQCADRAPANLPLRDFD